MRVTTMETRPQGRTLQAHPPASQRRSLHLLGGFRARAGDRDLALPACTWRLVAFLAIVDRPVERIRAANSLWLDKSEQRAQANLRSCLWRLRQVDDVIVRCTATHLRLGEHVGVDLRDLISLARGLADRSIAVDPDAVDAGLFCAELLPDWYDDFVEIEREQLRQLRLHALEALAVRLQEAGRTHRALDIALTAVAAGPLRESAHRLVISIHLDEGNISEALRQYGMLCALLRGQLGVGPSRAVRHLIAPWLPSAAPAFRGPEPDDLRPRIG